MKLFYIKEIVIEIEKNMFELLYTHGDKGAKYLNRAKAIASNLHDKNNTELKERIINNDITPKELVTMDVKEMASSEMQNRRKQAEEEGFKSRRSDWNKIHAKQSVGLYTCENCKGSKTSSHEMQIRGADEPMTL
jgi:transcription elongation factor S-II